MVDYGMLGNWLYILGLGFALLMAFVILDEVPRIMRYLSKHLRWRRDKPRKKRYL